MSSTFVDDARDRAFERLYERYVREVYRYVLAVLRNPAEADDVTQTTFLYAYRAMQAGETPLKPHNWLIAIAHNACRSRVRFAMRRPKEVPLDEVAEQLAVQESERLNVRELLRALARLPFNQRAALTMRELEGRSYPEIAETLGVTVPAVEGLIARARRTLRLNAGAIRGLTVFQLPRSLRKLFDSGDAAGGAIGAGAAAKAAAVLVTGVVVGGVGYTATVGRQSPPTPAVAHVGGTRLAAVPPAARQPGASSAAPAASPHSPAHATARLSHLGPSHRRAAVPVAATLTTPVAAGVHRPSTSGTAVPSVVSAPVAVAASLPDAVAAPVTVPVAVPVPAAPLPPVAVPPIAVPSVALPPVPLPDPPLPVVPPSPALPAPALPAVPPVPALPPLPAAPVPPPLP